MLYFLMGIWGIKHFGVIGYKTKAIIKDIIINIKIDFMDLKVNLNNFIINIIIEAHC